MIVNIAKNLKSQDLGGLFFKREKQFSFIFKQLNIKK